jgi:glucosyl-3-phosphoglycerate phosphatase
MRLILVRHGETAWNRERRLQGQTDEPLSGRGEQQSRALQPLIAASGPKRAITSDLRRARDTAALLGFKDAITDARLREANLGDWSGRLIADILAEQSTDYHAWRAGSFTPPKGEDWGTFRARVSEALSAIMHASDEDVVVIAHGGVIRAACDLLLGLRPANVVPVGPATMTVIDTQTLNGSVIARLEGYNLGPSGPTFAAPD